MAIRRACQRLFVGVLLVSGVGAADRRQDEVPAGLRRRQRRYQEIWQGAEADLTANRRNAARLRQRAAALKPRIETSKRAKKRYQEYLAVAGLFEQLAEKDRMVLLAFTKARPDAIALKLAFQAIPRLEDEIKRISGREVERRWLTPAEARELAQRGWTHDRGDDDVLPFARERWSAPEDDAESARGRRP